MSLFFDIFHLWFIDNKTPDEINVILENMSDKFNPVPVYFERDVADLLFKLAAKNDTNVNQMVNEWIRKDIQLMQNAGL